MIIDHPTHRFDDRYGSEPCKAVQCDFCSKLAPHGHDLHGAVEKARSAHFSTVPGATAVDPRKWSCPQCTSKRSA
jgi:hypothetical protein